MMSENDDDQYRYSLEARVEELEAINSELVATHNTYVVDNAHLEAEVESLHQDRLAYEEVTEAMVRAGLKAFHEWSPATFYYEDAEVVIRAALEAQMACPKADGKDVRCSCERTKLG